MKKVCIIIPAYNEEMSIGKVVSKSKKYGDVVVINDGSKDQTKKIAKDCGAIVLNNIFNEGYDISILKGIKFALTKKYNYILTIDADGQHPTNIINKFLYFIKKDYDLVIGNRKKFPRFSEKLFNFYTSKFYSIPDALCGMKCYSTNFLRTCNHIKYLNSIGTYYVFHAIKKKLKIKILDLEISKREYNSSKMGFFFKANLKIFKAMIKIDNSKIFRW